MSTRFSSSETDPRPRVRVPSAVAPGAIIAGLGLVVALALLLIVGLGHRTASERPLVSAGDTGGFPEPPPLAVPPAPERQPERPPVTVVAPVALQPAPPRRNYAPVARPSIVERSAPVYPPPDVAPRPIDTSQPKSLPSAIVIDTGVEDGASVSPPASGTPPASSGGAARASLGSSSADEVPVRSSTIRSRTNIVPAGTLIPAVLETPIDSARPGLLRAIVTRDVRGFDGTAVLIPRGTGLTGEYDSDIRPGQSRVLATWTRLIRPDGTTSRIASPAADDLGGSGIPGRVHSFFWRRFAGAVLQSALAAGVAYAGSTSGTAVIVANPATQGSAGLGQVLTPGADLKPKITVKPGASINVFVARDLELPMVAAAR